MKRRLLTMGIFVSLICSYLLFVETPETLFAKGTEDIGLARGRGTTYCLSGTMANGEEVRYGVCAACNEWFGKTLAIYQRKPDGTIGDFVGYFEVLDKGGTDAIKKGQVIDVWRPSKEECQKFNDKLYEDGCGGKIYIQVIDAKG